ncbi:acyltransferase [Alkalibacterium sp. f15]|uniref:acyltransferase n=1 Tax=Alkalibacterium sp. f15 TaxID=3414029 RepID=UPI003BF846CC
MSNETKMKIRDSNFELLRVLSMYMIVVLHIGTHGIQNYIDVSVSLSDYNELIYYFIRTLAIIAVSLYVLMSGYFSKKSKFQLSKLIELFLEVSFFSTVIYLVNVMIGVVDFNFVVLLNSLFSVLTGEYWFVTVYFVLYAISPFLNILIDNMVKKEHLYLLVISFLIFSVWQFIYPIEFIGVSSGYGLVYFVFLYMLAAYLQKYDFVIKDFKRNTYLFLYIVLAVFISLVIYWFGGIGRMLSYNSPLVMLMSYCLFQYFKMLKIKSPKINLASTYVFGIYLIHEQSSFRQVLWGELGIIEDIIGSNANLIILKMIGYTVIVFIICWVLSVVIKTMYNFSYKILYKTVSRLIDYKSVKEVKV